MADDGFDLARFLEPIEEAAPAGADPRQDYAPTSAYYRLRDVRAEARAAERAMDASPEEASVPPQWRTIADLAARVLASQAKDLEIAAWYTEALLRLDGFAGLAAGFRLMQGLVERFWDHLHPRPDEEGLETTLAALAGLAGVGTEGTLAQPIRKVPLLRDLQGRPIALWQIEQADTLQTLEPERREARIATGALPLEQIERAAATMPREHWAGLVTAVREALAAWQALGEALEARAGAAAPPTSGVRTLLEAVLAALLRFGGAAADAPEGAAEGAAGPAAPAAEAAAAPRSGPARPGEIATREDALRLVEEAARWFRRMEPHSPLGYALEEAARRGRLTLPDLLAETMQDEAARQAFLTALGIRPPPVT